MSSMGELTFFLGLQVKQQPDGIFISQDKSMIGSLMYLTASRPDIMFAVCACARFQVNPKASHLNAVKRIFRAQASHRKSTTDADICCKPANCCGQVLWIQNQMMDYDFNFMNTKIHIDNESTIRVIKNPVAHSRTKHIKIHLYFIRDCYEKRLIEVIKIHTDSNVADLLTKGFDVTRFNFLVTTAKSRTINNISYIDATVVGKPVTILEASIRSDLLFDDADGIDSLNNQAIFDNIQLMRVRIFKGKWLYLYSLFDFMLVQQTKDEGEASERPFDSQPIPSHPHPSEDQPQTQTDPSPRPSPSIVISDSNPEGSGGNHGGQSSNDISLSGNEDGLTLQSVYDLCVSLCKQVIAQAKEIKALKAQVKKLKKRVKPLLIHHKSWMKSVALKKRLASKTYLKKKGVQKGYVSKQGRKSVKSFKGEPSVHKDPAFDDLDDIVDDAMDYMESEDAQDEGRTSSVVLEEKESADKEVSIEAPISTVKPNEGTDKRNKGTGKQDRGTDSTKVSIDRQGEGTADQNEGKNATQIASTTTSTPTPTIFGDDETIAQVLITMSQNKQKEKEKGVEIRNVEDTERPRPTSTRSILTLRPLPKIDPKDKDKKRIEEEDESDTESENITEAKKKFK
ncbi:hypothetical protein Tco_1185595 [Tanacetum coccineum]